MAVLSTPAAGRRDNHNPLLTGAADVRVVEATYSGRMLVDLLVAKIARRLGFRHGDRARSTESLRPAVSYNGLVVFDRDDLVGGGIECGADYPRALLELGIGRGDRVFVRGDAGRHRHSRRSTGYYFIASRW